MDFKINEEWLKGRIVEQSGTGRIVDVTATGEKEYTDKYGTYTATLSVTVTQTGTGIVLNIKMTSTKQ